MIWKDYFSICLSCSGLLSVLCWSKAVFCNLLLREAGRRFIEIKIQWKHLLCPRSAGHIYIYINKLILSHCFSTWMGSILEESSAQAALKSCWISECSPDSPRPGWSVTQAGQNNSSNSPGKLAIAYLFWRINSKCALNFPGLWMVSRKNRRKGRESKQIKQIKQIPFSDLQPHCPQRGFPNNCTFKELLLCHEKVWSHHSIVSLPTAHINK